MDAKYRTAFAAAALIVTCGVGLQVSMAQYAQPRTARRPIRPQAKSMPSSASLPLVANTRRASKRLRSTYSINSDTEKLRWSEDEIKQFHRVPKHAYVLDLDVPGPGLRAEQNIPAANDLYRRAMEYKDRGFGSEYVDNQIRARVAVPAARQPIPVVQQDFRGSVPTRRHLREQGVPSAPPGRGIFRADLSMERQHAARCQAEGSETLRQGIE